MFIPCFTRICIAAALSGVLFVAAGAQGVKKGAAKTGPLSNAKTQPAPGRPKPADILAEMNLARAQPAKYADYLEEMKTQFKGQVFRRPGAPDLITNEGVAAVNEAIRFLRAAKPLPALHLSAGMSRGANDHAQDMAKHGINGHKGSDGSLPEDRSGRYGRLLGNEAVGENIAYDGMTAREVVTGFVIDDGTASRGHRRNVFSNNYKVVGIGIGDSPSAGPNYVVTFADGYSEGHGGSAKGKGGGTRSN